MKQFTPEKIEVKSDSALHTINTHRYLDDYCAYVGLDVHKETIAIAVASRGRAKVSYRNEIPNRPQYIKKMVEKLTKEFGGELILFSYEAGPCGYDVYHQLIKLGVDCEVVAPSLIPKKAGDRVKTDKRDAIGLASLSRSGELTAVWVPEPEQEAMRDLTRAREDLKAMEIKSKQLLGAFLLRHGRIYEKEKSRWTRGHFLWLETVKFTSPIQQIVLQEYIDSVESAVKRVEAIRSEMDNALKTWSLRAVVEALRSLRGVDTVTAMTVMAELGDISRFDNPRKLMAFLGLVPSEYSSGGKRRLGGITKTGNSHVRRILIESSWSYRFTARKTKHLRQKESKASDRVKAIAWAAQKRLCSRYQQLLDSGKAKQLACTAIARELSGFIWAIVCEVMGKPHASRCITM